MNKLAIFCGSKNGNDPIYVQQAAELGSILASRGKELIYGGGKKGLMGAAADAAMAGGGIVRGVIPKLLTEWEHQHNGISDLVIVEDMHIRKKKMYELCDAAIFLPGGFGTMDELFEMLTWNQLSIHDKAIFILNSGGFYDHLLAHLKFLMKEGFLYAKLEEAIIVLDRPGAIEQYL